MLSLELTDREVELVLQGLRMSEKQSRTGFGRWVARNADIMTPEQMADRMSRYAVVMVEFVSLRAKFGDTEPVKTE